MSAIQEIIVDNFAGGGGASTGIEMALGRPVDIAINHDPEALALHKANHPQTAHFPEDVFAVDPVEITKGQPVGLAWFSPDCKDFSKAKGGKPRSKKIRGLAWVMVKWAAKVRPRVMFLENVEEFQGWGPLLADGTRCPKRIGNTFRNFVARLRNLGYEVDWRELRACDYGAPTIRKRLFLVARCDGNPIVWPAPTHGAPSNPDVISGKLKPWRTAAECIDWSIPCPSIFLTKEEGRKLGVKRPLAFASMRRIARGIFKFVVNAVSPFIVRVAHGDISPSGVKRWGNGEHSADRPLGTISGSREFAVVAPHVTKFRTGSTGSAADAPLHTVTAGPKDNPAGAPHAMGLVSATLVQTGFGERPGQLPRAPGLEKPLGTVVGGGQKHALVTGTLKSAAFLTEHANGSKQRVFDSDEPLRTQCAEVKGGHFAVCQAFLAKHYGGNETPGSSPKKPFDTITAKDHHAVVAAHVVRQFGESVGNDVEQPVGTITSGGGGKAGVVTSYLSKLYGTTTGHDAKSPLHTVTSGGNHIAEVRAFLIKYYGAGGQDQDCREPMHTIPARDRIGIVIVEGEAWIITDIGMRMLEPHELYLAQGFPADYIINVQMTIERRGKKVQRWLPKHAQVRMCGNSVCPPLAEALVTANVPELSVRSESEAAA